MKTCIYARKSTKKKTQSNTIENQIKVCERYAYQIGLEIVDTKVDVATGLNDFNRPEVKELIKNGIDGQYQCVIIKGISRIYRDIENGLKLIKKLHMNGIRVISVEEAFDTSQNVLLNGLLDTSKLSLYLLISEMESKKTSERIKLTQIEKVKMGMWNNPNSVPFGYNYNKSTKKLEINIETTPTVMSIFNMYEQGNSISEIISNLELKNVPPPRSNYWREDTLRYILRNRVYTGSIYYSEFIKDEINKKENFYVENSHEPIIDIKQFNAVQNKLAIKAKGSSNQRSKLNGLIKCSSCNSSMTLRKYHYTGEYYYYCSGYIKNGKSFCSSHKVKADFLEKVVTFDIEQFIDSFDNFKVIQFEFNSIKSKILHLNTQSCRIINKFLNEEISNNRYQELVTPLNEQITSLSIKKDLLEAKLYQFRHLREVISKHKVKFNKLDDIEKEFLNTLILNIIVGKSKITINFTLDFS